jgi:hypothetical protein
MTHRRFVGVTVAPPNKEETMLQTLRQRSSRASAASVAEFDTTILNQAREHSPREIVELLETAAKKPAQVPKANKGKGDQ